MVSVRSPRTLRTTPFLIVVCFLAFPVQAKYSGGTGDPNDPYQIATAADLIALGETPEDYDKHFILTADIDLDPNLPGRKVFDMAVIAPDVKPDDWAFSGTPFAGIFDGRGHMISHLTIRGEDYVGLLGQMRWSATVKNLGVVDVNIAGSGDHVGGLVGDNVQGAVTQCYSTGGVSGGWYVGGLVGLNGWTDSPRPDCRATVTQCYSTVTVSGGDEVGGLVGTNARSTVDQCYSSGGVTGTGENLGGLVGRNPGGSVIQCYSTGTVAGSGQYIGGLVGQNSRDVLQSFWDMETSGQSTSSGGTGKTTAEMQTARTFLDAGWDFVDETENGPNDIWKIVEGQAYPLLSWQKYSGGTGEPDDPYQIATAADLIALGETPGDYDKHFILTADIDLDPNLPGGRVFDNAVIAGVWKLPFTGVFDGNSHTISHLTIVGEFSLGLFGQLGWDYQRQSYAEPTCTVTNLAVEDVNIVGSAISAGALAAYVEWAVVSHSRSSGKVGGKGTVGGLVGHNKHAVIDCHSGCTVTGDSDVGGLVGNNNGSLTDCCSTGTVNGGEAVGGLVGRHRGSITQSCSTGAVSGKDAVGGLVGRNGIASMLGRILQPGDIDRSYSTAAVKGETCVGGLIGEDRYGSIRQCYSTGTVRGSAQVGGFVSEPAPAIDMTAFVDVAASFWDVETSGLTVSSGGQGKTTAEMQTAKTFLDAGWDFVGEMVNGTEDIWWILEGKDYPRLWWELIPEN